MSSTLWFGRNLSSGPSRHWVVPPEKDCPPTSFSGWRRHACLSGPWEDAFSADPVTPTAPQGLPSSIQVITARGGSWAGSPAWSWKEGRPAKRRRWGWGWGWGWGLPAGSSEPARDPCTGSQYSTRCLPGHLPRPGAGGEQGPKRPLKPERRGADTPDADIFKLSASNKTASGAEVCDQRE